MFDGYPPEPTTKDTTYLKRSKSKKGRLVNFSLSTKLSMSKEKFLLNKENKQAFLKHLTAYMNSNGIKSVQSHADADLLIASTAVDRNLTTNVIVIGKDTDLLILLLHHYQGKDSHKLYFTSSGEKNFKAKKVYDIDYLRQTLPPMIVECILPIHAFLGRDTVSRVRSIGKGEKSLKKIIASEEMQMYFREFNKKDADNTTIAEFGEKLLCQFYASKADLALNSLRYRLFHKKVVTATTAIAPEGLPPTSDAAMFHSYRAYHQTQVWRGEKYGSSWLGMSDS